MSAASQDSGARQAGSHTAGSGRARLAAGTRLNGIYEVDRPIGMGGMGEIYIGHVIETGDPVAIKLLLPEFSNNAAALTLFRKEASALHHVHHDAVVRYYVFTVEPVLGRPYLAMEYVDGRSLSHRLEIDGPLSYEAVCVLAQRLASGLQAAHERGIVHRDVSPDNIIIPAGDVGRAKIIDFGIARSTQHGTVIGSGFAGKFNYVSPEQLGLFGGDVTPKSDIYSLGLVLVHALTGSPVDMGGSQVEIIEKRRKVPDLGALDLRIRPLIERMLEPDPARRVDSMFAVAGWQFGTTPPPRRGALSSAPKTGSSARAGGRRWVASFAALPLIAAVAGAGAYYYYGTQAPVRPAAPPSRLETGASLAPAGPGTPDTPPPSVTAGTPVIPAPAGSATAAEKIRQYVAAYDGGACFFVSAVAISDTAAALEGFGASTDPFATLDADFQRAIGFEADIGVRQVTQPQCPAVSFLGRLRGERANAPRLDIDRDRLNNGDVLSGTVDRYGERNIDLVVVSNDGTARVVSDQLKPGTDAKTFGIRLQRNDASPGRQPQLLIAIASTAPLATLRSRQPADTATFFTNLLNELSRTGGKVGATARYVMLEK